MEFEQYVAARRVPLVRAAVLLGVDETTAPRLVDDVLVRCASRIGRSPDPDPLVHAALAAAALPGSEDRPAPVPDGDGTGLAVRRLLAGLPRPVRTVAVLAYAADLTPSESADALRVAPAEAARLETAARAALGAADDLQARDRLLPALDSVAVPLLSPLERPRRRRWPLVAATAVAAVVTAALVVTGAVQGPTPGPDRGLGDDQVPSLLGYRLGAASELLAERGLEVREVMSPACDPPGLVVGTSPPTGARVSEGDTVVLMTAFPSGSGCVVQFSDRADAWEFLGFAAGRGAAPRFADSVAVVVDGSDPVALSSAEAADPARWGDPSVLTVLAGALSDVYAVPGSEHYRTPQLTAVTLRPAASTCGVARPAGSKGREALSLTLRVRVNDGFACPLRVDLYRTDGRIDTVALYTGKAPIAP